MAQGWAADIRELIVQKANMPASHEGQRASVEELITNYQIDSAYSAPAPRGRVVIFDDVLTTGRHYKAALQLLAPNFANVTFRGLFIARRVVRPAAE